MPLLKYNQFFVSIFFLTTEICWPFLLIRDSYYDALSARKNDNSRLDGMKSTNSIDLKVWHTFNQKIFINERIVNGVFCFLFWLLSKKGESLTFRATSQSILATLNQCLDIINQREEYFRKKMDSEIERRRQSEDLCKSVDGTFFCLVSFEIPIWFCLFRL